MRASSRPGHASERRCGRAGDVIQVRQVSGAEDGNKFRPLQSREVRDGGVVRRERQRDA